VGLLEGRVSIKILRNSLISNINPEHTLLPIDQVPSVLDDTEKLIRNVLIKSVEINICGSDYLPVVNAPISTNSNVVSDIRKRSPLDISLKNGCGVYGSSKGAYSSSEALPAGCNISGLTRTGLTKSYSTSALLGQTLLSQYSYPRLKLNMNIDVKNYNLGLDKYLIKDSKYLGSTAFYVASSIYNDADESLSCEIVEITAVRDTITT
jgi:hypothetical protein